MKIRAIFSLLTLLTSFVSYSASPAEGTIKDSDGFRLEAYRHFKTGSTFTINWKITAAFPIPDTQTRVTIPYYSDGTSIDSIEPGVLNFPYIESLMIGRYIDSFALGDFANLTRLKRFEAAPNTGKLFRFEVDDENPQYLYRNRNLSRNMNGEYKYSSPYLYAYAPGEAIGDVDLILKKESWLVKEIPFTGPIWYGAFDNCHRLKSLNIESGSGFVDEPGGIRFRNCVSLEKFLVGEENEFLMSHEGKLVTLNQDSIIAFPPKHISSYTVEPMFSVVGPYSFNSCKIDELTIPPHVSSIGKEAFNNFTGKIIILSNSTEIGENAFGMIKEAEIICPAPKVSQISEMSPDSKISALNCYLSDWVVSSNSLSFKFALTEGASLSSVICNGKTLETLDGSYIISDLIPGVVYNIEYTYSDNQGTHKINFDFSLPSPFGSSTLGHQLNTTALEGGFDVDLSIDGLNPGQVVSKIGLYDKDSEIYYSTSEIETEESKANGLVSIRGLKPFSEYTFNVFVEINGESLIDYRNEYSLKTKEPQLNLTIIPSQTSLEISLDGVESDESIEYNGFGISFWGEDETLYELSEEPFIKSDLYPGTQINYFLYAKVGTEWVQLNYYSTSTLETQFNLKAESSPTAVIFTPNFNIGDAYITDIELGVNDGRELQGFSIDDPTPWVINGLNPRTNYSFIIKYKCAPDEKFELRNYQNDVCQIKTEELELETLSPKCITDSEIIAAAATNISQYETKAGFQWKKVDAPESLEPSVGYSFVLNGKMEGIISNLQSTSYYNVRAFYKADNGTLYSGEWITFDPSDFSYFTPTFDLYSEPQIFEDRIIISCYILRGSEEIKEQGIEYGPLESFSTNTRSENSGKNLRRVKGEGNLMTVTLSEFDQSGEYGYRPYVVTDSGEYFGAMGSFTSPVNASIDSFYSNREIKYYYNLSGIKSLKPHKGINIVVYDDGTYKKVFFK